MPVANASVAQIMDCRGRASATPRAFTFDFTTQSEEGLPHQMKHAFQMVGLGEHIDQVRLLDSIASLEQACQVTGEGSRIAGHIGHAWRSQVDQAVDDAITQPAPWWIDNHEIGL